MFQHQAESLSETKDRVRRLPARIREVQDREIGAVNIIMAIDQEEFHRVRLAKAKATPTNFLCSAVRNLALLANDHDRLVFVRNHS